MPHFYVRAADADRAKLVRRAFELYAKGVHSKREVLEQVTVLGLRTKRGNKMSPQCFGQMLKHPLYAGRIRNDKWGIDVQGDFRELTKISEDLTLVKVEHHGNEVDGLDVEAVLEFAEHVLLNARRLWEEFPLELRSKSLKNRQVTGVRDASLEQTRPSGNKTFCIRRRPEIELEKVVALRGGYQARSLANNTSMNSPGGCRQTGVWYLVNTSQQACTDLCAERREGCQESGFFN